MKEKTARAAAPNVFNGTYTVSHSERGHYTLKLHTAQKGNLAGKRIISLLTGPDNENNFTGVAFWDDEKREASAWKRFLGKEWIRLDGKHWAQGSDPAGFKLDAPSLSPTQKKLAIWADLVNHREGAFWQNEGYHLDLAGRCVVCNRKLTDPESIKRGIGPTCEGRS